MRRVYDAVQAGKVPALAAEANAQASAQDQFYMHLYRGLCLEAMGNEEESAKSILLAVQSKYSQVSAQDYMTAVARVHCATRCCGGSSSTAACQ
jgi:hypothetical protein